MQIIHYCVLLIQVNYNRDLVNLLGQLREAISHLLCCEEIKDQAVTQKLNQFSQELEQYSVAKGLMYL